MTIALKNDNRPFARCLNFQARVAFIKATEVPRAAPMPPDFEDYWSEGVRKDDLLENHFNSMAESPPFCKSIHRLSSCLFLT